MMIPGVIRDHIHHHISLTFYYKTSNASENLLSGTSLVIQWFNTGGTVLIPGWGTKIPHASRPKNQSIKKKRKENQKQHCNKFKKEFNNDPHPKKKKNLGGKKKASLVISWNFHVFLIILVSKFFQYQLDSYHFHAFLTQQRHLLFTPSYSQAHMKLSLLPLPLGLTKRESLNVSTPCTVSLCS